MCPSALPAGLTCFKSPDRSPRHAFISLSSRSFLGLHFLDPYVSIRFLPGDIKFYRDEHSLVEARLYA